MRGKEMGMTGNAGKGRSAKKPPTQDEIEQAGRVLKQHPPDAAGNTREAARILSYLGVPLARVYPALEAAVEAEKQKSAK